MAAYTLSVAGSNGMDAVDRVLECVRQNGFPLSVAAVVTVSQLRSPISMTFSIASAVGVAAVDSLTGQLRNLFGVNSVAAV